MAKLSILLYGYQKHKIPETYSLAPNFREAHTIHISGKLEGIQPSAQTVPQSQPVPQRDATVLKELVKNVLSP